MRSKVFTAQYHGVCQACMDDIEPGDDVLYDEYDELIHADCREPVNLDVPARSPFAHGSTRPKKTSPKTCPECNMQHAGECP